MTIDEYSIVTVCYEVRENHAGGELLERMDANYPFKFMFGVGRMLLGWERRLYGKTTGASFAFTLSPEEAYGMPNPAHILNIPRHLFYNEAEQINPAELQSGQFITLTAADGKASNGKILDWDTEFVRVDCNHALAGKTLCFSGVVLDVRQPTVDELVRKQYIDVGGARRE
ncbi:MAG: hypothetical protein HC821_05800 [Lewinella sp.]|nr:hypothetical protein [Lewinella sp.]